MIEWKNWLFYICFTDLFLSPCIKYTRQIFFNHMICLFHKLNIKIIPKWYTPNPHHPSQLIVLIIPQPSIQDEKLILPILITNPHSHIPISLHNRNNPPQKYISIEPKGQCTSEKLSMTIFPSKYPNPPQPRFHSITKLLKVSHLTSHRDCQ